MKRILALMTLLLLVWVFWGCNMRTAQDEEDRIIQNLLDEGTSLRDRRLFDQAETRFNQILKIDALHAEATYELALTYFEAHRWYDAMDWFDAVRIIDPQRREAYLKRWTAILEAARGDSLTTKAGIRAVRREIAGFLKCYPWDWESLNIARHGAELVEDSLLTEELTSRILLNYPNSPAGYEIISTRFYDGLYPIWRDNAQQIDYLREFLTHYGESDFRETAWSFLLRALHEETAETDLRHSLSAWMSEDVLNPLPYERAVHYLRESGTPPDSLLPLARTAVDLCRGWRGKPLKHIEHRIREGKILYAGTRLNMAQVLIDLDRLAEAKLWLQDGLKYSGFDTDDQQTRAPFFYFQGVIAEKEDDAAGAFDQYVTCLIEGDVRNHWSARADSALARLYESHFSTAYESTLETARARMRYDGPVFEDVTAAMGFSGVRLTRVAWGDANGDGFDDLLLGGRRLWINRAGESFDEVTHICGIAGEGIVGGVWADVNLDGRLDLFCAGRGGEKGADRLFINESIDADGIPHFRDVSALLEIDDGLPSEGAAWGDLQGDGRPDLYVANYELPGDELALGTPDRLYLNLPDQRSELGFTLLSIESNAGFEPPFGNPLCGRGVNWGDFDNDGDQDIYVSNYRLQENFLWVNQDGAIEQLGTYYGVAGKDHEGWRGHTIGSAWGDFDNDGDLDLLTANLAHPRYIEFSDRTCLYENRIPDGETFRDVRREWGIKYEETHADPAWGDVDGDGDLDLYLTSVYPNRRSFLYLNDLDQHRFRDVTCLAGVRMFNGWGCAFSDFDRDGDLDLAVGSGDGVRLYRNQSQHRHWLEVELRVPGGGYGTRFVLRNGENLQMRELKGGKGTSSQESGRIHFAWSEAPQKPSLQVIYPSGNSEDYENIDVDRVLVITPKRQE